MVEIVIETVLLVMAQAVLLLVIAPSGKRGYQKGKGALAEPARAEHLAAVP